MSKRIQQYPKLASFSLLICTMITGCASQTSTTKKDSELAAATKEQLSKIEEKLIDLETRFGALNEKFNLLNSEKPVEVKTETKVEAVKVHAPVAVKNALIAQPVKGHGKFADSFHHDEATDRYREAKILFDTHKYSDAILEFSDFIKNNPRHVLACNAQYHIGLSYLNQKEFKIAEEELTRVLVNHPHSNVVPDTLVALATVSAALGKTAKVSYFREKMNSHFANSPQGKALPEEHEPKEAVEKTPVEKPQVDTPQPPTAPVPEFKSSETHGEEPSVVKQ
jgi:TolA-binding protein